MASLTLRVALATFILNGCGGAPRLPGPASVDIIKGEPAVQGEFPWQARLLLRGSHVCGAVLIDTRWVLTAAHCVTEEVTEYQLVLGEHDVSMEEGTEQQRRPVAIYRHPAGRYSDLALLRLRRDAELTSSVQPVRLPADHDDFTGVTVVAAGWGASGATLDGPVYPHCLHKVTLTVLSSARCYHQLAAFDFAAGRQLCAAPQAGHGRLCWGDSGGALVHLYNRARPVLAAVTSWGLDCGRTDAPSVFVSVARHLRWIRRVMASQM